MEKAWKIYLDNGEVWFIEDNGTAEKVMNDAKATFTDNIVLMVEEC